MRWASVAATELISTFSAKDDIRALLVTDPAKRMTIHQLMQTPLVTGEEPPKGIAIPGAMERESSEEPDEVIRLPFFYDKIFSRSPKCWRFLVPCAS